MKQGDLQTLCVHFQDHETEKFVLVFMTYVVETKTAIHAAILSSDRNEMPKEVGVQLVTNAAMQTSLMCSPFMCLSAEGVKKTHSYVGKDVSNSEEAAIATNLLLSAVLKGLVKGVTTENLKEVWPHLKDEIEFEEIAFKNGVNPHDINPIIN